MNRLKLLISLFVLAGFTTLMAQTVTISGTVTSADDGIPIPSVSVTVKGTTLGMLTDAAGRYSIAVPASATSLTFTFVGMKTITENISGRSTIDVVMQTDMLGLDEVVVTALGITREKKALGYAVQEVSGSELANAEETNIVNALQGKAAGVQITRASGAVGSSAQILIRGIKSFGDNQPLWVVDGTPISNSSSGATQWSGVDFGNNASDIDPEIIESISILKGANAAALYGSRARNGVVLVTTKRGKAGQIKVSLSNSTSFDNIAWLPAYQNEYGQGVNGEEYIFNIRSNTVGSPYYGMTYQDYAHAYSFRYVNGMGGGRGDGTDESWGPRLDAGLNLNQFFAPADPSLTLAQNLANAAPWVSHPNNVRDFFQTGITSTSSVSMEGGTDNMTARMTYTNVLEKGTIPNTDQKRNQINLSTVMNLTPKLKVDVALNYAKTGNDNLPGQGYDVQNIMQSIGGWFGRQVDMKLLEENWDTFFDNGMPYNWNSNYHNNPYWTVNKNTTSRNRERIFGNATATYQLTDWLNIVGRYGMDYYSEFRKHVTYEGSNDAPFGTGGYFWQNQRDNRETNADVFLNFQKDFSALQVSGNIGASYRNVLYNYGSISADMLTVPNFFDVSNVQGSAGTDMYRSEYEQNSIFGALNLGYANQLYLDFTIRNDWSSTLPKEEWSYPYPSVSLGWIFTETFGLTESAFSFGKLRASWAKVGSDTDPYSLSASYGAVTPAYDGNTQFGYPDDLPPIGLRPEFTTSTEFGLEAKFFDNRLGFDVAYFNNVTTDQIITADISGSSGFTSMRINAGEIESNGVEVSAYGEIVRTKDFSWMATVNWSKQKTVVNRLAEGVTSLVLNSSWSPTTVEARPGEPFGQIYGIAYQRDEDGNKLLDGGYEIPTDAPVVCGNTLPDWLGSINNSFRYKQFTGNFMIDAKWGGDIFTVTKWFGDYSGITETTVANNIREDGVVAEGMIAEWIEDNAETGAGHWESTGVKNDVRVSSQAYFGNYWGFTEPGVVDGSYVKLREINLGYDVRFRNKMVSNLNVGLYARNVAVLYLHPSNDIRIDPETGYGTGTDALGLEQYQLPPVRSMGFKLRVDF